MAEAATEKVFVGTSVSGGVAIGPLYVLDDPHPGDGRNLSADNGQPDLRQAIAESATQIEALIAGQDDLAGDILGFQLALLEDEDLLQPIFDAIDDGAAPETAWAAAMDREISEYQNSGDKRLAARADDLDDLKFRVLHALRGTDAASIDAPPGAILVTRALTPSGFLNIDWSKFCGAATLEGSSTSHVAILARARGIPLMVGMSADIGSLTGLPPALLDLRNGHLIVDPTPESLDAAQRALDLASQRESEISALIDLPARTADGTGIKVLINVDDPSLLSTFSPGFCDGIGLTRTEFLFSGAALPDEDTQLSYYRGLITWADGRPVTVRTLDAGGDKPIAGITQDGEANPFLGVRGVRLSLSNPQIFRIQLRALARAAVFGDMKIMVPMVTAPWELAQVNALLDEEISGLRVRGIACARPLVGMMVEVPAAAIMARDFVADFFSIGSNDLIQYTTASARDNSAVANLADAASPAVLALIRATVQAGHDLGIEVSLCGDMASSPDHIAALLDAGLRVLSCAPSQVGAVKLAVSKITINH